MSMGGPWCHDRICGGPRPGNLRGTIEVPDYSKHNTFRVGESENVTGSTVHAVSEEKCETLRG